MKKIKNLRNSFADNTLFIIYFLIIVIGSVLFNEAYQLDYKKSLELLDKEVIVKSEKKEVIQKDVFKVKMMRGKISLVDPISERTLNENLKEGDIVPSGQLIKTGTKAFIVFSFGAKNTSHMKVGQNTSVILKYRREELAKSKKSLYNQATEIILKSGNILFDIKDKYKKDTFKVQTKKAVMGVRGTVFLVSFDQKLDKMAIAVQEGMVAMINLISTKLTEIKAGEGFMILKSGLEINLNFLDIFPNFDIFNDRKPLVDEQAVKDLGEKKKEEKVDEIQVEKQKKKDEAELFALKLEELSQRFERLAEDFNIYLRNQEITVARLEDDATYLDRELDTEQRSLKKRKVLIEKDLLCLQSSARRCPLENRTLLIKRGFPRIMFNNRTKRSMAEELLKYVEEKESYIHQLSKDLSFKEKKIKKLKLKIRQGRQAQRKLKNMSAKTQLAPSIRVLKNGAQDAGATSLYDDVKKVESELAE